MSGLRTTFRRRGQALRLAEGTEGHAQHFQRKIALALPSCRATFTWTDWDSGRDNFLKTGSYALRRRIIWGTDAHDERVTTITDLSHIVIGKRAIVDKFKRRIGLVTGRAVSSDWGKAVLWVQREWAQESHATPPHAGWVELHGTGRRVHPRWPAMILPLVLLYSSSFIYLYGALAI